MPDRHPAIPQDHPLRDCPSQTISISWPTPVDRRLDELVSIARDAARDTNRREMLAALVLAASPDPEHVDTLLKEYRLATARDALIEPEAVEEDNVIRLPKHRPGPR